jgi:hypothetical protein
LIVSFLYSFFCPEFVRGSGFQFFIDTEPQLTLFDSALKPDAAQRLPRKASRFS